MDELLSDFLSDTTESLEIIEAEMLRLEARPGDASIVTGALRHLHSIKGACGFLALPRLSALSETAETFLIAVRADGATLSPRMADAILRCLDRMKGVLAGLENSGAEPGGDDAALIGEMHAIIGGLDTGPVPAFDRKAADPAPRMLRVNADALDALAEMAGELARARDALAKITAVTGETHAPLAALSKTAGDLIALTEHLRRRPVAEAWRPLPRIAREAAGALGKEIELTFAGETIELDTHIVEAMKAPLIHLIRNAIAHGVEGPTERLSLGKQRAGRIRVSVQIEKTGEAVFQIVDDGAGLDPANIRKRGIENGMISAARAARLSDQETIELLFAPGFSTAARVNALAGRGIGLDAVKASVEKLGGKMEVEAAPGIGAAFRIRVPGRPTPTPVMIVDPSEPAHDRLKTFLSAAGYEIEHGSAPDLPQIATHPKEQSA